jgi:hypothetical protein
MTDKFHFMPDEFHLMPEPTHNNNNNASFGKTPNRTC